MDKTELRYWRGTPAASVSAYREAVAGLATSMGARIVVEVGVYRGGLSRKLAALPDLQRLILVDSWQGSGPGREPPFYMHDDQASMDQVAASVKAWAATVPNVVVLHMPSIIAASTFENESIDFFHTDGDHTLEGIMGDIRAWLPKVRSRGMLSGDNYEMPTVAKGVDRLLPWRRLAANGRVWWWRKE